MDGVNLNEFSSPNSPETIHSFSEQAQGNEYWSEFAKNQGLDNMNINFASNEANKYEQNPYNGEIYNNAYENQSQNLASNDVNQNDASALFGTFNNNNSIENDFGAFNEPEFGRENSNDSENAAYLFGGTTEGYSYMEEIEKENTVADSQVSHIENIYYQQGNEFNNDEILNSQQNQNQMLYEDQNNVYQNSPEQYQEQNQMTNYAENQNIQHPPPYNPQQQFSNHPENHNIPPSHNWQQQFQNYPGQQNVQQDVQQPYFQSPPNQNVSKNAFKAPPQIHINSQQYQIPPNQGYSLPSSSQNSYVPLQPTQKATNQQPQHIQPPPKQFPYSKPNVNNPENSTLQSIQDKPPANKNQNANIGPPPTTQVPFVPQNRPYSPHRSTDSKKAIDEQQSTPRKVFVPGSDPQQSAKGGGYISPSAFKSKRPTGPAITPNSPPQSPLPHAMNIQPPEKLGPKAPVIIAPYIPGQSPPYVPGQDQASPSRQPHSPTFKHPPALIVPPQFVQPPSPNQNEQQKQSLDEQKNEALSVPQGTKLCIKSKSTISLLEELDEQEINDKNLTKSNSYSDVTTQGNPQDLMPSPTTHNPVPWNYYIPGKGLSHSGNESDNNEPKGNISQSFSASSIDCFPSTPPIPSPQFMKPPFVPNFSPPSEPPIIPDIKPQPFIPQNVSHVSKRVESRENEQIIRQVESFNGDFKAKIESTDLLYEKLIWAAAGISKSHGGKIDLKLFRENLKSNGSIETLLIDLLKSSNQEIYHENNDENTFNNTTNENQNSAEMDEELNEILNQEGEEKAIQFAIDHKLWSYALTIAGSISQVEFNKTVTLFLDQSLPNSSELKQTLSSVSGTVKFNITTWQYDLMKILQHLTVSSQKNIATFAQELDKRDMKVSAYALKILSNTKPERKVSVIEPSSSQGPAMVPILKNPNNHPPSVPMFSSIDNFTQSEDSSSSSTPMNAFDPTNAKFNEPVKPAFVPTTVNSSPPDPRQNKDIKPNKDEDSNKVHHLPEGNQQKKGWFSGFLSKINPFSSNSKVVDLSEHDEGEMVWNGHRYVMKGHENDEDEKPNIPPPPKASVPLQSNMPPPPSNSSNPPLGPPPSGNAQTTTTRRRGAVSRYVANF